MYIEKEVEKGLTRTHTPIKPKIIAIQRLRRTTSCNIKIDKIVENIGEAKVNERLFELMVNNEVMHKLQKEHKFL